MLARIASTLLLILATPASAAVTITFYSKEFGTNFPHAFVATSGATDADPATPVDYTYGFTAKTVSPAILMGPVYGHVEYVKPGYMASSDPQFSLVLTDAQYRAVLATVEKWRSLPGKSYELNTRNCVFFVGDIARAIGLTVVDDPKLMKKPRSYLVNLRKLNPQLQVPPATAPMTQPLTTN